MLASGLTVGGLLLPGPPDMLEPVPVLPRPASLPIAGSQANQPNVTGVAHAAGIPVYRVGRLASHQTKSLVRSLIPGYLLSVCFPRLIRGGLSRDLNVPALNVHPSLLPHLRGPDPMFWTFKNYTGQAGVTIHALSARFDAGPVAARQQHQLQPGITEIELETELAGIATALLSSILPTLSNGGLVLESQDETQATYAPFPQARDFQLDQHMTIDAAYAFFQGLRGRDTPISIDIAGARYVVQRVAHHCNRAATLQRVEFADGNLYLELGSSTD